MGAFRMKVALVVLLALVAVAAAFDPFDPCPGPVCPQGCCTQPGWECCEGEYFCAKPGKCPTGELGTDKMLLAFTKDVQNLEADPPVCEGTKCPTGCCKEGKDWFCCADGDYCAKTADGCPNFLIKSHTGSMASNESPYGS